MTFYPANFKIENLEKTADAWLLVLRDSERNVVMSNLSKHVKTNRFPPTLADLLQIPIVDKYENGRRAIPNVDDTLWLIRQKEERELIATPKEAQKALAVMAKHYLSQGEEKP